jgi:hypothetical protein
MLCIAKLNAMTDLNRALVEIRSIRRHVAQTTEFRGYGPATLFATAILAALAGMVQAYWLPDAAFRPAQYVALWLGTAVFCAALIASQMLARANRIHSSMADEMIRMAVAQFLPAAIVGVALPFLLLRVPQGLFWILPGLWQIVFGLGVFACSRCLPRAMLFAGAWFLLAGLGCIALGDARALAPMTMSVVFGIGMAMVAAIHYFSAKKVLIDDDEEF